MLELRPLPATGAFGLGPDVMLTIKYPLVPTRTRYVTPEALRPTRHISSLGLLAGRSVRG